MSTYLKGAALALAAALGGAGLAVWASGPPAPVSASPAITSTNATCRAGEPTVTVDGYGTAKAPPDEMTISLGSHTSASTASAALAANASKAQAIVGVLVAAGVPKAQIQTSNLSVAPNYNQKGEITGYQVDNDLTVTLLGSSELPKAGPVIDAAGRAAGNSLRVNGISFSLSNGSAVMAAARRQAVRQARAQAAAMASAAGETLGPLCSLQDKSQSSTPPPQPLTALPAGAPSSTTPVEPGSEQVSADVEAVFALQPAPAS
ncbi:MAG: SIMPL domain-containing protein [Actinomycetota bacterium]|jgi:uncharacterized protein YggE|nr:SIMPL domain-containing protein [Actinomycetota bacterium]